MPSGRPLCVCGERAQHVPAQKGLPAVRATIIVAIVSSTKSLSPLRSGVPRPRNHSQRTNRIRMRARTIPIPTPPPLPSAPRRNAKRTRTRTITRTTKRATKRTKTTTRTTKRMTTRMAKTKRTIQRTGTRQRSANVPSSRPPHCWKFAPAGPLWWERRNGSRSAPRSPEVGVGGWWSEPIPLVSTGGKPASKRGSCTTCWSWRKPLSGSGPRTASGGTATATTKTKTKTTTDRCPNPSWCWSTPRALPSCPHPSRCPAAWFSSCARPTPIGSTASTSGQSTPGSERSTITWRRRSSRAPGTRSFCWRRPRAWKTSSCAARTTRRRTRGRTGTGTGTGRHRRGMKRTEVLPTAVLYERHR
mmetsp:Transcript_4394/g.12644  ORF Transcript_4394/g.12644 Transcript_4394/m.12644 type:complete len:360 (+) Transcript_4394:484-1563(+)